MLRRSRCLPLVVPLTALMAQLACGGDGGTEPEPDVGGCEGTPQQCLRFASGWSFAGRTPATVGDVSVVQLPDGRYRMYGFTMTDASQPGGLRAYLSYVSVDGQNFVQEPGTRLTGNGIHMGYVIAAGGGYRMYYVDQTHVIPSQGTSRQGSASIRSAWSADGLTFGVEPGSRLTYLGTGNEAAGVNAPRPVRLPNGSYRMYYHGHAGANVLLLSATSPDGLTWTREPGVRLSAAALCPPETDLGYASALHDASGALRLYISLTRCTGNYQNAVGGIWEARSSDGLNFTFSAGPVVQGYVMKSAYTGSPLDPGFRVEDPAAFLTAGGIRVLFGLYYSTGTMPQDGIYLMQRGS